MFILCKFRAARGFFVEKKSRLSATPAEKPSGARCVEEARSSAEE